MLIMTATTKTIMKISTILGLHNPIQLYSLRLRKRMFATGRLTILEEAFSGLVSEQSDERISMERVTNTTSGHH